jgi:hypothetical protein
MLLLLESIVFEDCQNQWSLSRPLMCLIMLQPEQYEQVTLFLTRLAPQISTNIPRVRRDAGCNARALRSARPKSFRR